jgi:hypothetical protein
MLLASRGDEDSMIAAFHCLTVQRCFGMGGSCDIKSTIYTSERIAFSSMPKAPEESMHLIS